MLPLNLSFRRLVLKYIPQLISKNLDNYESLTALRHQIKVDVKVFNWNQTRENASESSTHGVNVSVNSSDLSNIQNYSRVQRLYIAKRYYALQQGVFQQTPASWDAFVKFINAAINYRNVQIQTLPFLWTNHLIYIFTNFWSQISFVLAILVAIGWTSIINFPPEIVSSPIDTASVGNNYQYQVIATDPNLYDMLKYKLVSPPTLSLLKIDSLNGLIENINPLIADTDTVIIIVSDLGALSDTQSYTLIISP